MVTGEIREKLDGFIRKYYLNMLLRGLLLGVTLLLAAFLFLNLTEYYGHFSTGVRAVLFWSFLLLLVWVISAWVAFPLLGLYRVRKTISYDQAARIIGSHFAEVQDKLLNLLQLDEMAQKHPDSALLLAGIEQKTKELKPVPFAGAINLKANTRYLRFLALPVLLTGVILVFQSSILTEGTNRIVNYTRYYAVKAPFEFKLLNKNTTVVRGEDLELKLAITGKSLPQDVYLIYKSQEIKMRSNGNGIFAFTINSLKESESVRFEAAGFGSKEYEIKVVPKPLITASEATLNFPLYTGRNTEKVSGTSDITVPEGTRINWLFQTRDAEQLVMMSGSTPETLMSGGTGAFKYARQILKNTVYKVFLRNSKAKNTDTLGFTINVIPDHFPVLSAEQKVDTADIHQFYFLGQASDDYGITKATFNYRYISSETPGKAGQGLRSVQLNLDRMGSDASFYYVLNMNAIGMAPSDEVEYYFEVWDNDGVNGSKSTKTQPRNLRRKSIEESRKEADITAGNVQKLMSDAFRESRDLQKQSKQAQEFLNRQKGMNWENKSKVEDLLQKQKEMFEKIDEIKAEKEKLKQQKEEFQKNDEFTERQKQLDELFKQMEDPELKKLMEDIQKLLEKQAPKDQLKDKLNQMEQMNKSFARDMEKLMEQYKQLQLEQKLNDNIERLEKLAEKEEKLAEKSDKAGKQEMPALKQEQEKLNREMEDIQKEIREAEDMNKALEQPMKLDMGKEENQSAEKEMGDAEKNLENNNGNKASENQKKAAEQLKKAAEKMKESLEEEKSKRMEEDYQKIRELLENLVDASFEQEAVFTELRTLRDYNPKFVALNARQMKVKEDCALIEDSLRALAKRQPAVSTFITRELSRINQNMDYALDHLKNRQLAEASMREQYVMTGLNNVAVMLMESMDNMQQKMAQKKKQQGSKSCNNPNNSGEGQKKSGKKLSEGQQKLGESLQQLQQKAQQQREGKTGEGGKQGQREMNKEYAKIALMQEALRRQLQEMRKQLESEGPEGKSVSRELKKTEDMMEQQERDLVNKKITPDMLRRQKEIETRMLEHEKSDRNQKQEDKRESKNPGEYKPELPPELKQYQKDKLNEREMLRKSPPELSPYYRQKSNEYLRTIK